MDNVYYKKYLKYKTKYLNLCNSQKAGGSADIYCFVCGGPTYSREVITDTQLLKKHLKKPKAGRNPLGNYVDAESNLENLKLPEDIYNKLHESLKTPNKHKWLNKIIILTPTKIVKNLNSYGEMYVDGDDGEQYWTPYFKEDSSDNYGHIMHQDCYNLLAKKYGKFTFDNITLKEKYSTLPNLINYEYINKYQYQHFDHTYAYLEHPEILESPLKNKKNKKRILKIKLPIRKAKKLKKDRPSPSESATLFSVGTEKKGNDGNTWIIVVNKKNTKRWKKLN